MPARRRRRSALLYQWVNRHFESRRSYRPTPSSRSSGRGRREDERATVNGDHVVTVGCDGVICTMVIPSYVLCWTVSPSSERQDLRRGVGEDRRKDAADKQSVKW